MGGGTTSHFLSASPADALATASAAADGQDLCRSRRIHACRDHPVPVENAWAAFADGHQKRHWFVGSGQWRLGEWQHDFRTGGHDVAEGELHGGTLSRHEADYSTARTSSTSVTSFEFETLGGVTRLAHTEHGIHLDGFDDGAQREAGSDGLSRLPSREFRLAGSRPSEPSRAHLQGDRTPLRRTSRSDAARCPGRGRFGTRCRVSPVAVGNAPRTSKGAPPMGEVTRVCSHDVTPTLG